MSVDATFPKDKLSKTELCSADTDLSIFDKYEIPVTISNSIISPIIECLSVSSKKLILSSSPNNDTLTINNLLNKYGNKSLEEGLIDPFKYERRNNSFEEQVVDTKTEFWRNKSPENRLIEPFSHEQIIDNINSDGSNIIGSKYEIDAIINNHNDPLLRINSNQINTYQVDEVNKYREPTIELTMKQSNQIYQLIHVAVQTDPIFLTDSYLDMKLEIERLRRDVNILYEMNKVVSSHIHNKE